ncbi:TonB-dependent receptor plug domain-containing protein [Puia sp. P3]|uniref:TonB-dependent receptor plug domain-containing protein n=1 Tax=Puia sp. P3 TaxID=3423952 RepID=UPI003D679001
MVLPYGKTTTRLSMNPPGTFKLKDLGGQPIGNIPGALEGRIPGLEVKQYNGVPGSAYGFLIRGLHSIAQGTEPLIIIDGMPIAGNNGSLSTIGSGSAQGLMGAASLNSIPLSSVAGIEVLRGASATAIYGSRGANGVILITLKQGLAGRTKWCFDVSGGGSHAVKTSRPLNTMQYRALREEAITNDGMTVDSTTAPDLFLWDSTRYTNYKKMVMGHTGLVKDARAEISGGDSNTVFLVSGNYHGEGAAFGRGTGAGLEIPVWSPDTPDHRPEVPRRPLRHLQLGEYGTADTGLFRVPILDTGYSPSRNAAGQYQWAYNGLAYTNVDALYSKPVRGQSRRISSAVCRSAINCCPVLT